LDSKSFAFDEIAFEEEGMLGASTILKPRVPKIPAYGRLRHPNEVSNGGCGGINSPNSTSGLGNPQGGSHDPSSPGSDARQCLSYPAS
jgi:hypothetical protein